MTDAELDDNFDRAGLTYEKIGPTPAIGMPQERRPSSPSCPDFALCTFRGTEKR